MTPPKTLVLELPSPRQTCPMACLHCIYKNVKTSSYPALEHNEILKLLKEGKAMGIEFLNIYPPLKTSELPSKSKFELRRQ